MIKWGRVGRPITCPTLLKILSQFPNVVRWIGMMMKHLYVGNAFFIPTLFLIYLFYSKYEYKISVTTN